MCIVISIFVCELFAASVLFWAGCSRGVSRCDHHSVCWCLGGGRSLSRLLRQLAYVAH